MRAWHCPSGPAATLGARPWRQPWCALPSALCPQRADSWVLGPGPDGIPVKLYGAYYSVFGPLLAALFLAVDTAGLAPLGFLGGVPHVCRRQLPPHHPHGHRLPHSCLRAGPHLVWFGFLQGRGDPFRSGCRTTPTTPRGQGDSPPEAKRPATAKA